MHPTEAPQLLRLLGLPPTKELAALGGCTSAFPGLALRKVETSPALATVWVGAAGLWR